MSDEKLSRFIADVGQDEYYELFGLSQNPMNHYYEKLSMGNPTRGNICKYAQLSTTRNSLVKGMVAYEQLCRSIEESVRRSCEGKRVGIAFSGGMDSGLLAALASRYARSVTCYT